MSCHRYSIGSVITLALCLLHWIQCETFQVNDVNMCCAAATILKRSFFIFNEMQTGNRCTVGPVVPSNFICNTSYLEVRDLFVFVNSFNRLTQVNRLCFFTGFKFLFRKIILLFFVSM